MPPLPNERDPRLSLLKVLGSIGVVLVHTSMYALGQRQVHTWAWWSADLGNALGRNMSSLFAMVAGAVLLARPMELAPVRFVAQRLRRLLPAVVIWSTFYFGWRFFNGEALSWSSMARDLAYGMPHFHLWFLFAMLGLYVAMPGVRLMLRSDNARPSQYYVAVVLAASTCVTVVGMVALSQRPVLFISYSPLLLVYLVCGYLFYRDRLLIPRGALWGAGAVSVGGSMLVARFLEPSGTITQSVLIQTLRAPLALSWVLVVFLAVLSCRLPNVLAKIADPVAKVTLGIYALHPFWIDVVDQRLLPFKQGGLNWVPAAVLVYVLSAFSSWCISRVPRLRLIVS